MGLDVAKLEKARELAGGIVQARCPACAEGGHDRTGEHLRIYPDGRFGCCVHPKDGEHRKRIFALAGERKPGTFTLRVKTPPALTAARSVKAALTAFAAGTLGTGEIESENGVPNVPSSPTDDFGTLGTGLFKSRARTRGDSPTANIDMVDFHKELKDSECPVPSVPRSLQTATDGVESPPAHLIRPSDTFSPSDAEKGSLPFLTAGGDLSIPFDSPERYHWWRGGQSIAETLAEVKGRMKHAVTV